MELTFSEVQDLRSAGVTIPTGKVVRSARWVTLLSDSDRLADLLAAEYVTARLDQVPADASYRSAIARHWTRRAVAWSREQVARWDAYADDLTAAQAPVMLPGQVVRWAANVEQTATRPTAAQVIAASTNPMGRSSWSLALEHLGTELLHAAGLPATRPDVWAVRHHTHVTRPDAVAYHGTARYTLPQPCRYGRSGHQPAVEYREDGTAELLTSSARATLARRAVVVTEYAPRVVREHPRTPGTDPRFVDVWAVRESLVGRRTEYVIDRLADDGTRHGWRGHRRITWTAAPKRGRSAKRDAARSKARAKRTKVGATGTRGPVVGPWSMSARSLPVAITRRELADQVTALESILRTSAAGGRVTFGPVVVDVIDGSHVAYRDHAYPIREWARRAALAGVDASAV